MQTVLWIASTAGMAVLLGALALRALDELLSWRPKLAADVRLPAWSSPANWHGAAVFAASLALLWLMALVAYAVPRHSVTGFFSHFWSRFTDAGDASHYLFIAQNGYVSAGEHVNAIVFYPLYPLLMAGLGALLGGRLALAGVILSQVCYGLSAVALAKLAKRECAHPGVALAAYWLYPFGFFCLGVFTEGLFLLLTILGLYLIRERRWIWAGLTGLLCALTRTQGILLLLPGVYCAWRDCREHGWNWRYLARGGPMLGFGIYLVINKVVCGSFFAYQYYESIAPWWQTPQWLGTTIAQQFSMALQYPGLANWIYWPQLFLYFLALALLAAGWCRKVDTSLLVHGTAYLGMSYTASWLISGCRYMLGCVPLYLCAGSLKSRALRALTLLLEALFLVYYSLRFMEGQAIM